MGPRHGDGLFDVGAVTSDPAALARYFGEHREEAMNIAGMSSVIGQARAVANIEAGLGEPPRKTNNNAPSGHEEIGKGVKADLNLNKMNTSDFIARRNQEEYGSADPSR